jgi:hypothetical protein
VLACLCCDLLDDGSVTCLDRWINIISVFILIIPLFVIVVPRFVVIFVFKGRERSIVLSIFR